jgi:sucrose-6-phosphate hydrolase SacC (GH32 family)
MLVEATSDDKVAVGLFTSQDLLTWTQRDPIFKDKAREHASCPQVFERDGRWYLTLLDHNTWVYEAGSLNGPWENAGFYHSTCFTAASRYADAGKRRLCWGFFTKRSTPERNVKPEYGGPTGVGRELVFNAAGKLGVRPLPELVAAIRAPAHNAALFDCARLLRGTWDIDAGKREFRCTGDDGGALLLDLPGENPDYYFEAEIVLASPASRADVLVRTAEALDRGYRIAADAGADEVAIRQARTGGGTFHEKDHPVADGKPVKVQIFVCDSMMEVFVDDHLSLSARVFDRSAHRAAIEITGGRATIRNHLLHYFKEGD